MPMKKKSCTIDGVYYESMSAATKVLGMGVPGIKRRLRSSNFPGYVSKHYTKIKRKKPTAPKSCTINGVTYPSLTAAATQLKMKAATLSNRLRSFDYPDYICADLPKVEKPIKYNYVVNGKKYRAMQEIADLEGVTREWIRQKLNSPRHPGYQRLQKNSQQED
ncbi:MAG: hypothetical protein OXF05_06240 [Hyphomicrobiales bacterium]|nr:hypothetical protein [Hyphomicrobiales bacterium]MCY4032700.1 hypothetical protein [Hyphomicrobiales bacterium]MCY4038653.1 hypothetical protein [Hyphomicrobiales bacterium]